MFITLFICPVYDPLANIQMLRRFWICSSNTYGTVIFHILLFIFLIYIVIMFTLHQGSEKNTNATISLYVLPIYGTPDLT